MLNLQKMLLRTEDRCQLFEEARKEFPDQFAGLPRWTKTFRTEGPKAQKHKDKAHWRTTCSSGGLP